MVEQSAPAHHVFWLTDQDAILANEARAREALSALALVLENLVPAPFGDISWASTKNDGITRWIEDLVAIPDLAGGALAELLANSRIRYSDRPDGTFEAEPLQVRDCTPKTNTVLDWYQEKQHPLQRFAVVLDETRGRSRIWPLDLGIPEKRSPKFDVTVETLTRIARAHGVLDEIVAGLDDPKFRVPQSGLDNAWALEMLNSLRGASVTFSVEPADNHVSPREGEVSDEQTPTPTSDNPPA